jgi:long-chain fatty acid transport protein
VGTSIELPETASVAATYESGSFDLLADWTWTGWSSIQTLAITRADGAPLSSVPLEFEDSWRAGLGLNYRVNESWMLRLGTAYDTTPVQDAFRTPRLPDQDRVWAAAGFQWKVGSKGALDVGYAHLFVKDGTSALPNQEAPTSPPTGALIGSYAAGVNLVGIQFRQSF